MDLQVSEVTLVALLLGTVRAAGFILTAPPFNNKAIPSSVKGALATMLGLVVMPDLAETMPVVTASFLLVSVVTELAVGAALGFIVQLLFTAVQTAGDILDVTGGFSLQPAYDPLAMTMNSTIGRLHYLLATTLLFTSGAHLVLVRGFVLSYRGLPLGGGLPTDQLADVLITSFSMMFLAALQIAGPLVAVLLLSDVALGILSRAAPAMQLFNLNFPVKILVVLVLLGLTFPLLPPALSTLIEAATRAMLSLSSG
ncbi:flagellar biosynthetic protein FliR [Modestobacter sp. I12A-02628]|uniref:Flagellar biosynthetic protein FliR n=1 Tax=Goekera deserti TaxID=2497753 RepID=A0A7K3WGE4_9ACTN|nr:flagellar biosynthetic protein FliR [Goekera deserti]MPQ99485.1 flagellar biosynthetic protein FliR [Goekera deserti]NDI48972.1 flagellar biosynthetic protein FliR [Goekera deserti]NEL55558.1 flagellar biosynthetic protein FliR [Goekera deserti]